MNLFRACSILTIVTVITLTGCGTPAVIKDVATKEAKEIKIGDKSNPVQFRTTQTLSGTKEAYAALLLNGSQIVGYSAQTTWTYSAGLSAGDNSFTLAARDQAGNIRVSGCEIFAEIGEIYSGIKTVPKGSTVIYDSVGMAIMDVAAAKLAYDLTAM